MKPVTVEQKQAAFLEQYAAIGVINAACRLVGIDRMRHYEWLQDPRFPDYPDRFARATQVAAEVMETAMVRRGVQGWDEPVYQGGVLVGTKRMYSDRLLEIGLKARLPEKYRERYDHQLSGAGGGPIQHQIETNTLTDEQIQERLALVQRSLLAPIKLAVDAVQAEVGKLDAAKAAYALELATRSGNGNRNNGHG